MFRDEKSRRPLRNPPADPAACARPVRRAGVETQCSTPPLPVGSCRPRLLSHAASSAGGCRNTERCAVSVRHGRHAGTHTKRRRPRRNSTRRSRGDRRDPEPRIERQAPIVRCSSASESAYQPVSCCSIASENAQVAAQPGEIGHARPCGIMDSLSSSVCRTRGSSAAAVT
jgi:hypothetical protein